MRDQVAGEEVFGVDMCCSWVCFLCFSFEVGACCSPAEPAAAATLFPETETLRRSPTTRNDRGKRLECVHDGADNLCVLREHSEGHTSDDVRVVCLFGLPKPDDVLNSNKETVSTTF